MVKRWWLLLMLGLLIMAAGIVVFCFPAESYMTLSVIFGVLMLVSGISELVVSLGSRNFFMMRGYSVVGAVLDLLLGIFLCCFPGVTLVVLPVVLGIWLLYHSFMIPADAYHAADRGHGCDRACDRTRLPVRRRSDSRAVASAQAYA